MSWAENPASDWVFLLKSQICFLFCLEHLRQVTEQVSVVWPMMGWGSGRWEEESRSVKTQSLWKQQLECECLHHAGVECSEALCGIVYEAGLCVLSSCVNVQWHQQGPFWLLSSGSMSTLTSSVVAFHAPQLNTQTSAHPRLLPVHTVLPPTGLCLLHWDVHLVSSCQKLKGEPYRAVPLCLGDSSMDRSTFSFPSFPLPSRANGVDRAYMGEP